MDQPAPTVSAADIERLIARDFPAKDVAAVRSALAEYGRKDWHREPIRVQAAMLKIADGSLARLRTAVATADQDFRDVLCAAEYPRYLVEIRPAETNEAKRHSVIADDWRQYREWFEKKDA